VEKKKDLILSFCLMKWFPALATNNLNNLQFNIFNLSYFLSCIITLLYGIVA